MRLTENIVKSFPYLTFFTIFSVRVENRFMSQCIFNKVFNSILVSISVKPSFNGGKDDYSSLPSNEMKLLGDT